VCMCVCSVDNVYVCMCECSIDKQHRATFSEGFSDTYIHMYTVGRIVSVCMHGLQYISHVSYQHFQNLANAPLLDNLSTILIPADARQRKNSFSHGEPLNPMAQISA
jgi:hypothetical protein